MKPFVAVWFCDFLCVISALASVRLLDWDNSVENYENSGESKVLPDDPSEPHNRRKYGLRFDPAGIRRKSKSEVPSLPTAIGPEFNFNDFLASLSNVTIANNQTHLLPNPTLDASHGITTPIVPISVPNYIPEIPHPIPTLPTVTSAQGLESLLHAPLPTISTLVPARPLFTNTNGLTQPIGSLFPSRPLPAPIVPNIIPPPPVHSPQNLPTMLSTIVNRVKNVFFGYGPTFIKRPPYGSRGFLNLFDVIKFQNGPCTGILNRVRPVNGTCYYQTECLERNGIITGTCAEGYGVCCVFKYACGAQTQAEVSYFESPNYPLATTQPLACSFTIHLQPSVEQVRLDLLFFELRQPESGNCVDDQFIVSGHNKNFIVPVICGINSGQHLYIDVDESAERKLELSVVGRNTGPRAFSIRATQLRHNYAPKYCLQYFTEPTGYIKSFNYDNVGSVVEGRMTTYLNNMNYAICIERLPDKCQVTYTNQVTEGELPFQLLNVNEQFVPLSLPGQAAFDVFSCPDDFIAINGVHLCGDKLNDGSISQNFNENSPITEYAAGPMVIPFQTDEQVVGRGFKLIYYQESC